MDRRKFNKIWISALALIGLHKSPVVANESRKFTIGQKVLITDSRAGWSCFKGESGQIIVIHESLEDNGEIDRSYHIKFKTTTIGMCEKSLIQITTL